MKTTPLFHSLNKLFEDTINNSKEIMRILSISTTLIVTGVSTMQVSQLHAGDLPFPMKNAETGRWEKVKDPNTVGEKPYRNYHNDDRKGISEYINTQQSGIDPSSPFYKLNLSINNLKVNYRGNHECFPINKMIELGNSGTITCSFKDGYRSQGSNSETDIYYSYIVDKGSPILYLDSDKDTPIVINMDNRFLDGAVYLNGMRSTNSSGLTTINNMDLSIRAIPATSVQQRKQYRNGM